MVRNNILVILSSPRSGNSTYAAKKFAKAIKGRKTFVDINKLNIKPCKACSSCEEGYKCVYNDDAAGLIRQVEAADVVVVAAPVFFTGVPGPLKIFIDRNQVQWEQNMGPESRVQGPGEKRTTQPETRNPKPKTGVIILTAGHNKPKYFRPAESEIRSFFAVNSIKTKLALKFGNMDGRRAMKKYAARLKAAVRKFSANV
jgi:multimeric flavodoxin WrbA